MIKLVTIAGFVGVAINGFCQSYDSVTTFDDIAVISRVTKDSITLRWAPRSQEAWTDGNIYGYTIERYTMVRDKILIAPEKKSFDAIKPLSMDRWESVVRRNKYGAIAAQALFGDEFSVGMENANAVSIVNKVKENAQRFSFALFSADLSPEVARMSGLWFSDRDVKKGEKYLYRVLVDTGTKIYRGSVFVDATDSLVVVAPRKLIVTVEGTRADLKWHAEEQMKYVCFQIEKSRDSLIFERLGDTQNITLSPNADDVNKFNSASDSITNSGSPTYYRVRGITPFGDISAASNVVSTVADEKMKVPVIISAHSVDNKRISLSWNFPAASIQFIQGFSIERGSNNREFKSIEGIKLIGTEVRNYIDNSPMSINYYRISALKHDGEKISSSSHLVTLVDSIPPQSPEELNAFVDENGRIELRWKQNSETDLYGYRVYKSNHIREEGFQLTTAPIADSTLIDKLDLRSLNKYVFYSVVAVDHNQNQSKLSKILKVKIPDKVKPLSPVMLPATSDSLGVTIRWMRSSSDDVSHFEVYRSAGQSDQWIRRKTIRISQDSIYTFQDILPPTGMNVRYTVVAVDSSQNESIPSSPVSGKKISNDLAPPIVWQNAEINSEQRTVKLRWNYGQKNVRCFKLFKSVNGSEFSLYKTIVLKVDEFQDSVGGNTSCSYKMIAVFVDGTVSHLSSQLQINF
jgi:uncharacterized protein